MQPNNIILFDGVCTLCNSFLNFLISIDKKKVLYYSSLQSNYAKENLDIVQMESVVFIKDSKKYFKSNAIIEIFSSLGGPWKTVILFKIIPLFIRDSLYLYISKNRYKWFGKKDICRIPTKEERKRFL